MESNLFVVTSVVAATEFLRRVNIRDWLGASTILLAAVIGGVAGWIGAPGVGDTWNGIVAGLGASGLVTVASRVNANAVLTSSVNRGKTLVGRK